MKVVLAEADPRMREVVRLALLGRAVVMAEVNSAWGCLSAVAEHRPDAVLLAADLPDHSGHETLLLLRRYLGLSLRVLLLGAEKPLGAFSQREAVGYLPYPFDAQDLLKEVDRLMARPGRRKAG